MTHDKVQHSLTGKMSMTLEDFRLLRDDSIIRAKGIETSPVGQHLIRMSEFAHQMVDMLQVAGIDEAERAAVVIVAGKGGA